MVKKPSETIEEKVKPPISVTSTEERIQLLESQVQAIILTLDEVIK